jgi:hypothetical protein
VNAPTAAWTIGQLATRVAEVLAAGVPGQVNGRVREVPDVRTLRWYTSIGLLDRPAAMRGRTALYGHRHLAQVVAVKRLQGEGWSLAEIQERLIGADDAVLEEIAAVPGSGLVPGPGRESAEAGDRDGAGSAGAASSADGVPEVRRARFWAAPGGAESGAVAPRATLSHSGPAISALEAEPVAATTTVTPAIHLAPDVTLLLKTGTMPDVADLPALAEAARPLLDLLRRLGLAES